MYNIIFYNIYHKIFEYQTIFTIGAIEHLENYHRLTFGVYNPESGVCTNQIVKKQNMLITNTDNLNTQKLTCRINSYGQKYASNINQFKLDFPEEFI